MIPKSDYIKIWPTEKTLGVTYNQVKAAHTKEEYLNFLKWMSGQTVGMNDKNEAVVYSHDYERWVHQNMKAEQGINWD